MLQSSGMDVIESEVDGENVDSFRAFGVEDRMKEGIQGIGLLKLISCKCVFGSQEV